MNKVVFQGREYPAGAGFWADAEASGVTPDLYTFTAGVMTAAPLTRDGFLAIFPDRRVGGWVWAPHKSFTVFTETLKPADRAKAVACFAEALSFALGVVARFVEARTGPQGRNRLPAEPAFAAVAHPAAADRSPHWHYHVYLAPRVRCPALGRHFAANGRQLYELRELFDAAATAKLAEGFRNTFGVRIEHRGPAREPALRDVPEDLCTAVSSRTQRIEDYLRDKNLPNWPIARQWAAWATRRAGTGHPDPLKHFHDAVLQAGFSAKAVMHRVPGMAPAQDAGARRQLRAFQSVRAEADRLAAERGTFGQVDLIAHSLKAMSGYRTGDAALTAADKVLQSPALFGLNRVTRPDQKALFTTPASRTAWERLFERIRDQAGGRERGPTESREHPGAGFRGGAKGQHARETGPKGSAASAVWDRLFGPDGLAVLVARGAGAVAGAVAEAYARLRHPIRRVHGWGDEWSRRSLARLVRDLRPRPRREAHRVAIRTALRPNFRTPYKTLLYAQAVYRAVRRPKERLRRGTLVVVERFGRANPEHVEAIVRLARGRAKVLLAEGTVGNAEVRKAAQAARGVNPVILTAAQKPGQEQRK